jgi:hypothetical protein
MRAMLAASNNGDDIQNFHMPRSTVKHENEKEAKYESGMSGNMSLACPKYTTSLSPWGEFFNDVIILYRFLLFMRWEMPY